MAITMRQARMALQELRDRRAALDMIDDILAKSAEAEETLKNMEAEKAGILASCDNARKLKEEADAAYSKSKADLMTQQDLASNEKAKLAMQIEEAREAVRLVNEQGENDKMRLEKEIARLEKERDNKEKEFEATKAKIAKLLETVQR